MIRTDFPGAKTDVTAAQLDKQIEAYQAMLPALRDQYGSVWALVVNERLVSTFAEFSQAARFVLAHHSNDQVLIRHTDERLEFAPFVQVKG